MDVSRVIDGKKYMWDGVEYEDESAANAKVETYRSEGFEMQVVREENSYYVFSRRVVEEVRVEGTPPI